MQKRFPALKFIFMSGYTNDAVIRRGIMDAEVAFVQKPFTPKSLAKKVREVLDQQSPPLTFPSLSGEHTPVIAR
jgi:CheY-like chemotaxis protein